MTGLPRPATPADARAIAEIHCAAWHETYPGLLPEAEIARASDLGRRTAQWQAATGRADLRIALVTGAGFASMGPQRDAALRDMGYPEELHAIYVLRQAQGRGLGTALLRAVIGQPFTILVLAGNDRATWFYRHIGARLLMERPEKIGQADITELVFGWSPPPPSSHFTRFAEHG